MEILETARNLGTIELCLLNVEIAEASVIREQITPTKQLRSKIDKSAILEETIIGESEGMIEML